MMDWNECPKCGEKFLMSYLSKFLFESHKNKYLCQKCVEDDLRKEKEMCGDGKCCNEDGKKCEQRNPCEDVPLKYTGRAYTGHPDVDAFLDECLETMRAKGHDYREGNDNDLVHNFRTVGEDMDLPMEKIWYIYASKHWKAIKTFIKEGGQSESEPIEGRIKDVLVYMLLLYKIVQEKKAAPFKRVKEIVEGLEKNDLQKKLLEQAERIINIGEVKREIEQESRKLSTPAFTEPRAQKECPFFNCRLDANHDGECVTNGD